VRKYCVHGVDALLSNLGDDLIEDLERVWARSVAERCEVAVFGTIEYVLFDDESEAVLFLVAGSTYLETAVDSKHSKSKGARLNWLGSSCFLKDGLNTASSKYPNTVRSGWPEGMYNRCERSERVSAYTASHSGRRYHTISPWPSVRADREEITDHKLVELLEKFVVHFDGLLDRLDDEIVGDGDVGPLHGNVGWCGMLQNGTAETFEVRFVCSGSNLSSESLLAYNG
jgi:hypothetical protein